MKTFAVLNQKGGTGKTTLAINLSAQLAAAGKRVLVVDTDPQGNATSASGVDKQQLAGGVYAVIHGEALPAQLLCSPAYRYHILPTNSSLAGAEIELAQKADWQQVLKTALRAVRGEFDYCLVDCPPSLGVLSVNALVAADYVLIPMQCEYLALEGLSDLAETVRRCRQGLNPSLAVAGIVRSMLDKRNLLSQQVSDELHAYFGNKVFDTVIPRNVRLAEAPSHQMPIARYAPQSPGAAGYQQLCEEFLQRVAAL